MKTDPRLLVCFPVLFAAACTGSPGETDTSADTDTDTDTDDTAPVTCAEATETGSLSLSLAMEPDYIPSMDEAPIGAFLASVFRGEDVSAIGPNDGAVPLFDIHVDDVDLSNDGGPVDLATTVADLPACRVVILGCLDSDLNDCDKGDPITLPNDNGFDVIADATTPVEVFLGLLNPS